MKPWERYGGQAPAEPWLKYQADEAAERRKTAPYVGPELTKRTAREQVESMPRGALDEVDKFYLGGNQAVARAAYGLKKMFTDLTPEEQNRYETGQAAVQAMGTPASMGQFTGDVAMTAPAFGVTGAAAPLAARGLPAAMEALATGTAGRAAVAGATGAAAGGALTPEKRGSHAIGGGVGGTLGEVIGSALSSGLVKLGPNAVKMFDDFLDPSLGDIMREGDFVQQGLGYPVRGMETAAELIPWLGSKLPLTKMKVAAQAGKKSIKRAMKEGGSSPEAIQEFKEASSILPSNSLTRQDIGDILASTPSWITKPITTAGAASTFGALPRTTAALATGRSYSNELLEGANVLEHTDAFLAKHLPKVQEWAAENLGDYGLGPASGYSFSELSE